MKSKLQRRVAVTEEGKPLAVLRPDDPLSSINAAKRAFNTSDWDEVQKICGPFTFVGWLSKDGISVLDNEGNDCGSLLQPGDHFTSFDSPADLEAAVTNYRVSRS